MAPPRPYRPQQHSSAPAGSRARNGLRGGRTTARRRPAAPSSGGSLSSKKRQKLVAEETEHMRAVLAHPAFIADPFAALQEHLRNTVAPQEEKAEMKQKLKQSQKQVKR